MNSVPLGGWEIDSVLIDATTVINNDGIRSLRVAESDWVLQPMGQKFEVVEMTSKKVTLHSNGETYFADYLIDGARLSLELTRPDRGERVSIEAHAVTADVIPQVR
ncbi:MAG: hypothetical protein ACPIA2_04355 [Mariniblastus sp.]